MKSLQIVFILLITNILKAKLFSREKSSVIHLSKNKKASLENWLFNKKNWKEQRKLSQSVEDNKSGEAKNKTSEEEELTQDQISHVIDEKDESIVLATDQKKETELPVIQPTDEENEDFQKFLNTPLKDNANLDTKLNEPVIQQTPEEKEEFQKFLNTPLKDNANLDTKLNDADIKSSLEQPIIKDTQSETDNLDAKLSKDTDKANDWKESSEKIEVTKDKKNEKSLGAFSYAFTTVLSIFMFIAL